MKRKLLVGIPLVLVLLGAVYALLFLRSGGPLDGTPTPVPPDWAAQSAVSVVQLETRPEDPYSVNLWMVAMGPAIYLHAGANRTAWVEHIEANPQVRLRIDEALFDLVASRVADPAEFAAFADDYERKYGVRPRNENVDEIYLFRLTAR
ncbi:MAG: hypothetical protein H6993_13590 [Pseudomonadales bacterium]|nr:hypothetical protein [Pseudomonadales bacterium]